MILHNHHSCRQFAHQPRRPHFSAARPSFQTAPASAPTSAPIDLMAQLVVAAKNILFSGWAGLLGQPSQSDSPSSLQGPWAGLREAVNGAVAPNTMPGFEEAARRNAATNFVKTQMSGTQLYEIMSGIQDPQAKAAFFRDAQGTGAGMNDLNAVVLEKMFQGDEGARNRWINLHNSGGWAGKPGESEQYGPGGLGSWDFSRGVWTGGNSGDKKLTLAGWGGN